MPEPQPRPWRPRNVTWTHFYGKEDSTRGIDFILLSPGLAREWVQGDLRADHTELGRRLRPPPAVAERTKTAH